jgi:hypothetical protein
MAKETKKAKTAGSAAAAAASKQALIEAEKIAVAGAGAKQLTKPTTMMKTEALFGNYGNYEVGTFEHLDRVRLEWTAPNLFELIPKATNPFVFVRHNGQRIQPSNFFTDGGSIPRLISAFNGRLTPWGYGPAYLIHDWEFDVHHCGGSKTFNAVRDTLMEALKTLMETQNIKNTLDFDLIYTAVSSPVARNIWNTNPPTCPIPPAAPE